MTIQEVALRLLATSGITSLDPTDSNARNQRGLAPGDLAYLASCINGAFQETFADGPSSISERRTASLLRAPVNVTLNVTQYTKVVAITGYESWMQGCTIRISGYQLDNEIVSSSSLLRDYTGTTATNVSATVYADAVSLDASVRCVLDPIQSPNCGYIRQATSLEEFVNWSVPVAGYAPSGLVWQQLPIPYALKNKLTGEPVLAFVEPSYHDVADAIEFAGSTAVVTGGGTVPTGTYQHQGTQNGLSQYLLYDGGLISDMLSYDGTKWNIYHLADGAQWSFVTSNSSPAGSYAPNLSSGATGTATVALGGLTGRIGQSNVLRVTPMPTRATPLTYRVKLEPPVFTESDIQNTDHSDPSTRIPEAWNEAIILPFAMQRWTGHPSCVLDAAQIAEVGRQYKVARQLLQGRVPQVGKTKAFYM